MIDQNDPLYFDEGLEEEESSIDIKRYLNAIIKKKWWIVAITVLVTVPWLYYVKIQPPLYEAETIIQFKDIGGMNEESLLADRMTELKSRRFAEKVVQQLGLCFEIDEIPNHKKRIYRHQIFQDFATDDNPRYGKYSLKLLPYNRYQINYFPADLERGIPIDSGFVDTYVLEKREIHGFMFTFVENLDSLPREIPFTIKRFRSTVDELLARKVVGLHSGRLLSLKLTGQDPVLVTQTVNQLAEVYRKESIYIRESGTGQKLKVLEQKLQIAKDELDKSQAAKKNFEQSHFISLDTEVGTQSQEHASLQSQVEKLEQQTDQLGQMLNRIDDAIATNGRSYQNLKLVVSSLVQMATFENNSEIMLHRTKLADLEGRRSELLRTLTEISTTVQELDSEILAVYSQIISAAKSHKNSLEVQIRQKNRRLGQITAQLSQLPAERLEQGNLARAVERNQTAYEELKQQVMELQMSQSVESEDIEIFQPAYVPEFPVNADKKMKAIMGFLVGLALGVGLVVGIEFMDKTIKSPDEIKKYFKLNILGTIPEIKFDGTDDFRDEEKIKQIDNQLVTHDYSPTPIGEAYRSLRTNLLFSKKTGQIKNLVITSTAPGDGKSFTSSNIAISMAQQRSNTLLVDADLRRGVLHNTFGITKEPGFTNFLTNSHTFPQIIHETYIPNLSVISCGSLLPNPSELLGSLQMKRFLEQAQRRFEFVIFDSPPLNAATDAVVIGTQVDGVVLVVRAGVTNREIAKAKLEMFKNVPAKILGVVLNGGDANLAHEAYSYYHY